MGGFFFCDRNIISSNSQADASSAKESMRWFPELLKGTDTCRNEHQVRFN